MTIELGRIEALFRYPVKSMRGESLEGAAMGWHGLEGDRRLALRRLEDGGGFPWLSASKLPDLVRYAPMRQGGDDALPTHVRTPAGDELPIFGDALAAEIGGRHGSPVQMMRLDRGIFDEAAISVISTATVREVCRLAGVREDVRRFRPNILVPGTIPFEENDWVGGVLTFGDAAIAVQQPDLRCSMVNLDPDDARSSPEVLRAVVHANATNAGVYCAVIRGGRLAVGQRVVLTR